MVDNSGFDYLITKYLGNNSGLVIYYDFNTGSSVSVVSGQNGVNYNLTGVIFNKYPSYNSGNNNLLLTNISGISSTETVDDILFKTTGTFLRSGNSGYFKESWGQITGAPLFDNTNCTFLCSVKNVNSGGVIFGSYRKASTVKNGVTYEFATGYNFGLNQRNQLYFTSYGKDGDYTIVAEDIELAPKNIISVGVSRNQVSLGRYDLAQNKVESQTFPIQTYLIEQDNSRVGYIGGGDFDAPLSAKNNNFFIDKFAVFNRRIELSTLKELSRGFISSLSVTQDPDTVQTVITGYTTQTLYNTGYTGVCLKVTGAFNEKLSGVLTKYGISSGSISINEGEIYTSGRWLNSNFQDVTLDKLGAILDDNAYTVTGTTAEATLGLDNTQAITVADGTRLLSSTTPLTSGVILVYPSGVTGFLYDEPTGTITVPLTKSITISSSSQTKTLNQDPGLAKELLYDLAYYKGPRIFG